MTRLSNATLLVLAAVGFAIPLWLWLNRRRPAL